MDSEPFPLRDEGICDTTRDMNLNDRIPKSIVNSLLRHSIVIPPPQRGGVDVNEDVLEFNSENIERYTDHREGSGVFRVREGSPSLNPLGEAIYSVITCHLMGCPICVILDDAKLMGVPGTSLSVRRVIRTLLEVGQNTTTNYDEISESLSAFAKLLGDA